jgi:GxxExxY protein
MSEADLNALSKRVLDAAFAVHTSLGPGLLEASYFACLLYELRKRGISVQTEVNLPVVYDGQKLLEVGYRIDMLVEDELILEIKATEGIATVFRAQLLGYLRHSGRRLGLLLNFNEVSMRDGIVRIVNRL